MRSKLGQVSALGTAVRVQREAQRLTQAVLAARAGLGVSTVRAIERGQGRLGTLAGLLAALGLELRGGRLSPGR
jgi:transcriptional regulator with XRE-family HTH domain